jgi:hypothetical protein
MDSKKSITFRPWVSVSSWQVEKETPPNSGETSVAATPRQSPLQGRAVKFSGISDSL